MSHWPIKEFENRLQTVNATKKMFERMFCDGVNSDTLTSDSEEEEEPNEELSLNERLNKMIENSQGVDANEKQKNKKKLQRNLVYLKSHWKELIMYTN